MQVDEDRVTASRNRLVMAYDHWRAQRGRASRQGEPTPETNSDRQFIEALRSQLELGRNVTPSKFGIPSTRAGWSNWRTRRSGSTAYNDIIWMRRDICIAIHALTGVDPTSNQLLLSSPVNSSDLVTLGSLILTEKSVAGRAQELNLEFVEFRTSDAKVVTLSDKCRASDVYGATREIGSVRYGIKQASLFVRDDEGLEAILVLLNDNARTPLGNSMGAELSVDHDDKLRWRIQPSFPKEALQARLENLVLCRGFLEQNQSISVAVSVANADVAPEIKFDLPETISEADYQIAKKRLIEKILKNRLLDEGPRARRVLSHSAVIAE